MSGRRARALSIAAVAVAIATLAVAAPSQMAGAGGGFVNHTASHRSFALTGGGFIAPSAQGFSGSIVTPSSASNLIIIALMGQSNSVGNDTTSNLTGGRQAVLEALYTNVSEWDRERLLADDSVVYDKGPYALQPRATAPTVNMGAELSMGRVMDAQFHNRFVVIKDGTSGSSLAVNWLTTGTYPAAAPNNRFDEAMQRLAAAATYYGTDKIVMVWNQGESDASDQTQANNYQTNLTNLIAAQRAWKTSWANTPWVIVELNNSNVGTYKATIRTAQTNVQAADPTRIALVNADDLAISGGQHYTADSLDKLGQRIGPYAYNLYNLIGQLVASYTYSSNGLTLTFTDMSTDPNPIIGGITAWDWNWGDNTTHGTTQNPSHTFSGSGTYTVTLTVTTTDGRTANNPQSIVVTAPSWTIDATSNKAVPANATEWNALLSAAGVSRPAPDALWLLQEASGNPADSIGSFTLTAVGTLAYQQTETGWTRKGIKTTDNIAGRMQSTSTSLPDTASGSYLMIVYIDTATPGGSRSLLELTSLVRAQILSNHFIKDLSNANSATGTGNSTGSVHPYVLRFNRTASTQAFVNDVEKLSVAIGATISGKQLVIGGNGSTPPTATYVYAAAWFSSNAEWTDAEVKAVLQQMGWTIPWSYNDTLPRLRDLRDFRGILRRNGAVNDNTRGVAIAA